MACVLKLNNLCRSIGNSCIYSASMHTFSLNGKHVLQRKTSQIINHATLTKVLPLFPQFVDNVQTSVTPNLLLKDDFSEIEKNEKLFKKFLIPFKKRKFRERKGKLMLEGLEIVEAALKAGAEFEKLFFSKDDTLKKLREYENLKHLTAYKIRERTMRYVTSNLFSPEVIAICKKPSLEDITLRSSVNTIPVTILCSDVRDPENMASILTIAAASGCRRILLTKGCVDIWDHKVLNSANGVQFLLPIVNNIKWTNIKQYLSDDAVLYVADNSSDVDISDTQVLIESDEFVSYPLLTGKNSANDIQETSTALNENTKSVVNSLENVPCSLYTEIAFPKKELVVYVGGETVGINNNIQELSHLHMQKIKLPLENEMDSLNVSVALSVILFEIKRQFTF